MLSGPLKGSAHKGEKEMIAICSGIYEAPNKTVPSSTNAAQEPASGKVNLSAWWSQVHSEPKVNP